MAAAKKKKKSLRLLVLVLIVAALIGVYFLIGGEEDTGDVEPGSNAAQTQVQAVAICPFEKDDIVKVAFAGPKFSGTVIKDGEQYYLEEEPEFPLNQMMAGFVFSGVASKADRIVAEDAELSVYGLDEPLLRITATDKNGAEYKVHVGDKIGTISENGYYACLEGDDTVYLVPPALYIHFNRDKAELIASENLPELDTATITGIEVTGKEFPELAIFHTGAVGDGDGNPNSANWRMEKPYPNVLGLSEAAVTELLSNYSKFSFLDPIDYKAENFAQYGLESPVTTLKISYQASSELTTDMLTQHVVLNIGNQNEAGDYYVNLKGSSRVYTMLADKVKALVAPDTAEMVDKRFSLIYVNTLSELEVNIGDIHHLYEMEHKEVVDEASGTSSIKSSFVVDGVAVSAESTSFNTFYTNFVKPTASYVLPADTMVEGEPVITLRYKRTKKEYSDLFMEYFPYDNSYYAVRINGVVMYAVDKRDVDTMINGINAYVPD